jgi:hypothetical protein
MKKIALWAGLATFVFTGFAQADAIQSISPALPGYDPFPAGDTVVSVTLTGTITGGSEGGAGGNDGADLFTPGTFHTNVLNAPIQVNLYWDVTAIDNIANLDDAGAGDVSYEIYAWYPNANSFPFTSVNGDYPWPTAPIASYTVVNNDGEDVPFSSGFNVSVAAFDTPNGCGNFGPQDCLMVTAQNPQGKSFEFLAANSDGTPASVDIDSQAAVNAFLSNPDNTYTLLYSNIPGQTLGEVGQEGADNDVFTANLSLVTSSPEPATWTLLAMALTGGALLKLRQRKRG